MWHLLKQLCKQTRQKLDVCKSGPLSNVSLAHLLHYLFKGDFLKKRVIMLQLLYSQPLDVFAGVFASQSLLLMLAFLMLWCLFLNI